jgi:predicted dehydrogenase
MARFGVDDTVLSLVESGNGAIRTLEASWLRPDGPRGSKAQLLEVMGTQGMIEVTPAASSVDVYWANHVRMANQAYVFTPGADGRIPGIYRDEIAHFLETALGAAEHRYVAAVKRSRPCWWQTQSSVPR